MRCKSGGGEFPSHIATLPFILKNNFKWFVMQWLFDYSMNNIHPTLQHFSNPTSKMTWETPEVCSDKRKKEKKEKKEREREKERKGERKEKRAKREKIEKREKTEKRERKMSPTIDILVEMLKFWKSCPCGPVVAQYHYKSSCRS